MTFSRSYDSVTYCRPWLTNSVIRRYYTLFYYLLYAIRRQEPMCVAPDCQGFMNYDMLAGPFSRFSIEL